MSIKNQKGFLLAESLIVATFVISLLIFLFVQFKNLSVSYDDSFKYNSVEGLYALDNVRTYLKENASEDKKIHEYLTGSKPYLSIYSENACNTEIGLRGTGYCKELMEAQNIKSVIFTKAEISAEGGLKRWLKTSNFTSSDRKVISENMKNFILRTDTKEIAHTYRLIAEFNDGSYATFNVGDEDWNSSKYNAPDYVEPSYNLTATSETCFTSSDLASGGVEITGYSASCGTSPKIPSEIDGKRVFSIGNDSFKNKNLTAVTIPPGVQNIKADAFSGNSGLTNVEIPESVMVIGMNAFSGCQISGDFIIPDNVTTIGDYAFNDNKITSVTLGSNLTSIGNFAFFSNEISKINFNEFLNNISSNAFASNKLTTSGDTSFIFPESLKTIGAQAFQGNSIKNVTIPENVTTIGTDAFSESTSWEAVYINGEDPHRFNATWTEIGWPISEIKDTKTFNSPGSQVQYTAPLDGYYRIDLWGAQGAYALCNGVNYTSNSSCGEGGKGAYTKGVIQLSAGDVLYINVGGKGSDTVINQENTISSNGGYNGGGNGTWDQNTSTDLPEASGGGGGATDIKLNGTKIMVAGGGGGASWYTDGGYGGNSSATITSGIGENGSGTGNIGASDGDTGGVGVAGGGGGYKGGSASSTGGIGGSSYISSSFLKTKSITGANSMPKISLSGTQTGHSGDGFVRITYAGKTAPK